MFRRRKATLNGRPSMRSLATNTRRGSCMPCNRSVALILTLFLMCFTLIALFLSNTMLPADLLLFTFVASEPPDSLTTPKNQAALAHQKVDECIFRNSSIYRKIFVYPNPGEKEWKGNILSKYGRNLTAMNWPWIQVDRIAREEARAHYDPESQVVQYTTELLVREIMINPNSCLRTNDPDEASLFYVPYLPSTEHHCGHNAKTDYTTSPYGQAIMNIIEKKNYDDWERYFGLTSRYWKQRNGSDHILVFSEPMHGLFHPRSKRGHFHFIHNQKQLAPPIVISVELSTTFVQDYPKCAAKNILVPYPNTHGHWFNGKYAEEATTLLQRNNISAATSQVALPAERLLAKQQLQQLDPHNKLLARPVAQFYQAGLHGTCTKLRKAMKADYQNCAGSHTTITKVLQKSHFSTAMRVASFCPCPGGDSPSAKRHFDSIIAGCIPIILSHDFVWPFTKEFDVALETDPSDFSLRFKASDYDQVRLDAKTCQPIDSSKPGLQAVIESFSIETVSALRRGVQKAAELYSWYAFDPHLPYNPLREGVLPNGGTAWAVVRALEERAFGQRWPACERELQQVHPNEARQFKC